jgi:peptidyl-prolyl cis-trans isomerase B (cyclophilin B)
MATTHLLMTTDLGDVEIELEDERAPKTVANFLAYVDAEHYDGTVFHRVIPGFMAQGGGFDTSYEKRLVRAPVGNEADNGLKNKRGTIAMARTSDPHSATAQFFVNVADNTSLDHRGRTAEGWGYTVFGKVTAGMEVIDRIVALKTGARGPFTKDAPLEPVVIRSIRRA